jgi:hypothetical protein
MTKPKPKPAKAPTVDAAADAALSPATEENAEQGATGDETAAVPDSPFRVALSSAGVPFPVWKESGVVPLRATRTLVNNNVQAGERFGASVDEAGALIAKGVAILDPIAAVEIEGLEAPVGLTDADAPHGSPIAPDPTELPPGRTEGGNESEGSDSRPAPVDA